MLSSSRYVPTPKFTLFLKVSMLYAAVNLIILHGGHGDSRASEVKNVILHYAPYLSGGARGTFCQNSIQENNESSE